MKIKEQLELTNSQKKGLYSSYKVQNDIYLDRLKSLIVEYLKQCYKDNINFEVELIDFELYAFVINFINHEYEHNDRDKEWLDFLDTVELKLVEQIFIE